MHARPVRFRGRVCRGSAHGFRVGELRARAAACFGRLRHRRAARYFFGTPLFHYRARCAETFTQVMNNAFPAGLIGVAEAAEKMDGACFKGA